jgi:TonB family protein
VVAHAGGAAWALHAAGVLARGDGASSEVLAVTETDVELEAPAAQPAAALADLSAPAFAPTLAPGLEATRPAPGMRGAALPDNGLPLPAPSSEAAADGSWSFSPTPGGAATGEGSLSGDALGAAVRAGVRATVAEDTRRQEDFARKHPFPLFNARDIALGLVPGGELVTLARDIVRRSRAPMNGRALLQFDTDGAGLVASVRVLDVSSGRVEWDQVASEIAASARSRPLRVPTGARGLAVTLEVTSALKTVNGAAPGDKPLAKALGAIMDPVGSLVDATTSAQRVVATRIVDVQAF